MSSAIFYQPYPRFRFTAAYKFSSILLSSAYSLIRCVCAVNRHASLLLHYCSDDRQLLIALAPKVIDPIARYWPRIALCLLHLHSTPPLGGLRRNIAMTFGVEKLEWCSYSMVKKCLFVSTESTNGTCGQTDEETDRRIDTTAQAALMHNIARHKTVIAVVIKSSRYMAMMLR